jgi:hypothetical protein
MPEKLSATAKELTEAVDRLSQAAATHKSEIRRTRIALRLVYVCLAVVTVLVISAGLVVANQIKINRQSNATTNEVLCPLLGLIISRYNPEAVPPDQRQAYIDAFQVLRPMPQAIDCEVK